MKPSEYFQRQCFIAVDPGEPGLKQLIQQIGSDNLLFGSDYPHTDYKPNVVESVVALQDRLSEKIVRKLLWDNPARFYHLE